MIYFAFFCCILYSVLILGCASYLGIFPIVSKNRFKYDYKENTTAIIEACIVGVSVYLYLLLGILTATGDSYFFASVIRRFTSDTPFSGFYTGDGITYPPLFNYLYYLLAQLLKLANVPVSYTNEAFVLAVKLPGILCVFIMALLLYRYAKKNLPNGQTILVLLFTLLNPAYLLLNAYICQIDALYTLFMLLTVMLVCEHRLKLSYFTFGAAVLCKFQTIFITPVIIYAVIEEVFFQSFSWKKFLQHLGAGLSAIFCMFLSYLPFVWNFDAMTFYEGGVLINFTSSLKSYGFATQNTYNFWTLTGYNSYDENLYFGPLTCKCWGTIFIILLVLLCSILFFRHKNTPGLYPMLGAVLVSGTTCFATRMMTRYLYPAIPLLIFGFLQKPVRGRFFCVLCFTILLFLLNIFSYLIYPLDQYSPQLILPRIISIYMLGCFCFLIYTIVKEPCQTAG